MKASQNQVSRASIENKFLGILRPEYFIKLKAFLSYLQFICGNSTINRTYAQFSTSFSKFSAN